MSCNPGYPGVYSDLYKAHREKGFSEKFDALPEKYAKIKTLKAGWKELAVSAAAIGILLAVLFAV
ncbi:MAG TPA: hypothetical protein PLH38_04720 [Clostridia bacterium]|nr:hypothetical protein [Clostridia bacterium]